MGSLKLRDCAETKTIQGVFNILKNDPVLKAVVGAFDCWDGNQKDLSVNQLPWVGVYLGTGGQADRIAWNLQETKFPIDIKVAVNGTNASDLLNLWNAVRLALNDDAMKALGKSDTADTDNWHIVTSNITKPAYESVEVDSADCLLAVGQLLVDIHVRTQRK